MSAVWKSHERETAKALGGKRVSRGDDFGKSAPDIDHSIFSIECKLRKKLPYLLRQGLDQATRYDENKLPVLVVKEKYTHGSLVVMKMKDFVHLFGQCSEQ